MSHTCQFNNFGADAHPCVLQTQVAIDTRTVDKARLFKICAGRIGCSLAEMVLYRIRKRVETPLNARIRRWYALHSFHARARLDLPTYAQSSVQRQVSDASDNMWGQTVVWQTLELATDIVSAATQLIASSAVLFQVLKDQPDGAVLATLTLFGETYYWLSQFRAFRTARGACAVVSSGHSAVGFAADMICRVDSVARDDFQSGLPEDARLEADRERCDAPQRVHRGGLGQLCDRGI